MPNFCMTLSYDGTRYNGWQRQGNTPDTVQGRLETALSALLGQPVEVAGSGRTDAGVHARMQTASFRAKTDLPAPELLRRLRAQLPGDIGVLTLAEAAPRFHARLSCRGKTYVYRVWNSDTPNVFERRYVYALPQPLDTAAMQRAAALLCGQHLLLAGPKATGKNVLAEDLAAVFGRPMWDVSMYVNVDAAALIGADTLQKGEVVFREGPICRCARAGGFGVLDEVNMARNEALAVLHATLDHRRVIDVPGYDRIDLDEAARFIGTMNYGYAGTRELNEALVSRFAVLDMPVISDENLRKLLRRSFPALKAQWTEQFALLFQDLRAKCDSGEISSKALDLRGLLAAIQLMEKGISAAQALHLGIVNKAFEPFERQLVADTVQARIPQELGSSGLFGD